MGEDRRSEEQKMDALLDALVSRLHACPRDAILTPGAMADIVSTARRDTEAPDEWSTWLDHDGRGCSLPIGVATNTISRGGFDHLRTTTVNHEWWTWTDASARNGDITRYRYRCERGGWVKRPAGWVPPEWLWEDRSPVRCEYKAGELPRYSPCDTLLRADLWDNSEPITHIRILPREARGGRASTANDFLRVAIESIVRQSAGWINEAEAVDRLRAELPREAKPEMPEGWWIDSHKTLRGPGDEEVMNVADILSSDPTDIRAAVDAYLDEMQRGAGT